MQNDPTVERERERVGPIACRACDLNAICRIAGLIAYEGGRPRQPTGALRAIRPGAALYRAIASVEQRLGVDRMSRALELSRYIPGFFPIRAPHPDLAGSSSSFGRAAASIFALTTNSRARRRICVPRLGIARFNSASAMLAAS